MKQYLFYLTLAFLCVIGSKASAQSSLAKPKNLRASYNPSTSKTLVRWREVLGASRYRLLITDADGQRVFRSITGGKRKRLKSALFLSGERYTVKVRAQSSSKRASKNSSTTYVHELSRKAGKGVLLTQNSVGRTGAYYLPPKFTSQSAPVMVAYHGSGGDGESMVNAFARLAKKNGFIIIAPSSRYSPGGVATWEIGTTPNSFTEDFYHTTSCINEVLQFENIQVQEDNYLTIGYSGGGSSAPYFASYNDQFSAFAVLHGGVVLGGLGERIIRGWFSTGETDTLRPPDELEGHVAILTQAGFPDVTFTSYKTGHNLAKSELQDVVSWWLQ